VSTESKKYSENRVELSLADRIQDCNDEKQLKVAIISLNEQAIDSEIEQIRTGLPGRRRIDKVV